MATAETVPFDSETGPAQCVAKPFRPDIRQGFVLPSMALKDRQPFPLLKQWSPFLYRQERSGQLNQSGIGLRGSEHYITRKHGALGKSSEDGLARVRIEMLLDFFKEGQHRLACRSEACGNLVRKIADTACRLIRGNARHVNNPPGSRIPRPKTKREWTFWKDKPRVGRHIQNVSHRHQIVSRCSEPVQEQDERAVAGTLPICATSDSCSQTTYLCVTHEQALLEIQILQQCHDAVERGFNDRLLVEGNECALLVGLDFAYEVLNLFRADFVVLAKPEGLDHLLAQPG